MNKEEAINVLNDYDINFERHTAEAVAEAHEMAIEALEQESCEDCCNGNQEEKAKLCQKSYIAGMEHNCENEEIIRIKRGTLKARTGRYVVYDVEWLKTHFNTTEAKIYGQPKTEGARGDIPLQQSVPEMPQPKTGHWFLSGGYWRCSECKEKALLKLDKATGGYREYEPVRSKYCPECGAKMQEEKK